MTASWKFGRIDDLKNGEESRHDYANVYAHENVRGTARLAIAPSSLHCAVLHALAMQMEGPFWLVYVLVTSRKQAAEPGRYQTDTTHSLEEVADFLDRFAPFLQGDGRHHLWIASATSGLVVYDRHNLIYAYDGPNQLREKFETALLLEGLRQTAEVKIPVPHTHCYHPEFDADEEAIFAYWPWTRSPLEPADMI